MGKIWCMTLAFLVLLACGQASADEKRWVVSEGTELKAGAAVSAETVAPLPVGTEMTIMEDGGRWLRVKCADGKEGWVYAGRVSADKPAAEVSGGGGIFGDSMQQSQIQSAKADSARSIRGLSPEVAQYAKQRGTPEQYKRDLDRILARKVNAKAIKNFLREGKIGEYAD